MANSELRSVVSIHRVLRPGQPLVILWNPADEALFTEDIAPYLDELGLESVATDEIDQGTWEVQPGTTDDFVDDDYTIAEEEDEDEDDNGAA